MIRFENVSKAYHTHKFHKQVLTCVNMEIASGDSIGICGANGAGKSTLIRLMSGAESPTSGRIVREGSMSWPIGYGSCFQPSLTGADNARFVARIYDKDENELLDYVEDFAQLGPYLHQPVGTYSSGMHARLTFGVSLAIDFDCYLVDEVTAVGDERFRARCEEALIHRRENATLIMVSHEPGVLLQYCKRGAVLYGGSLISYDTMEEAYLVHHRLQNLN